MKAKLSTVVVDKARYFDAIEMYFLWKELDSRIRSSATRGVNFPETISEALACYALGFKWNKGTGGDALDGDKIVEFKATSNWDRDVSSFSPSEQFDCLYFLRLNKKDDELFIYDLGLNSDDLKKIRVNQFQTLLDQQLSGRRPRFSVIEMIINKLGLKPIKKIILRTKVIEDCK